MPSDLPIARRSHAAPPVVAPAEEPTGFPVARRAADEDDDRPRRRRSRRWDDDRPRRKEPPSPTGFVITLGAYAGLLWTMIGYMLAVGIYLGIRYREYETIPRHVLKDRAVIDGVALGAVHAFLVFVALVATWRPALLTTPARPLIAWTVALPALTAMLMVNFGFGLALRFLVEVLSGQRPEAEELADLGFGDGWIAVLLVCVQPAVVEEVFFRFLLLGHLRPHVGMHGAVWLSSFFFATAHLGQLIAFPVLFLLGAVLAYARVYGGGLALPILLHFLHNLAVLYLGPYVDQIHFN